MRCHRLAASVLVALLAIGFHGRSTASSYVGDRLGEEKASTPLPAIAECGAFENCVQCSVNSECGWCSASLKCLPGTNDTRPSVGVCSQAAWHFQSPACGSCHQQTSCATCTHLPACGWCASNGKCFVGGSRPPIYSQCDSDDWSWVGCGNVNPGDEWRVSGPLFIGVVIVLPVIMCVLVVAALCCIKRAKPPEWNIPDYVAPRQFDRSGSGLSRFRPTEMSGLALSSHSASGRSVEPMSLGVAAGTRQPLLRGSSHTSYGVAHGNRRGGLAAMAE